MKLNEAFAIVNEADTSNMDVFTVSAIRAQTGTKEKIERFLADFGLGDCPDGDELITLLTAAEDNIPYDQGNVNDDTRYSVDTSGWSLEVEEGDYGNQMLVATFYSRELGQLRDEYINTLGDDELLDHEEGDYEFTLVLCSDIGEYDQYEVDQARLSFSGYIPNVVFQTQIVGVLTSDQVVAVLNGMTISEAKELED